MNNLLQRTLMFIFFIPFIAALIVLFPAFQHLALQVVAVLVATGLAIEVANLYGLWPLGSSVPKAPRRNRFITAIGVLGAGLIPLFVRMAASFGLVPDYFVMFSFVVLVLWIFTSQVILSQFSEIEEYQKRTNGYLMIIVYPALGMSYFLAIVNLPQATSLLLIFLGAVFLNDTVAYLFGRLFGKFSARPIKISPNKTLVGFISGFLTSIAIVFAGWAWNSALFPGGPGAAVAIGVLIGLATIIGDLFESGLKRSVGIKDSGTVILGRGGLLDSADSLIFAAPVFYYAYKILNSFPL